MLPDATPSYARLPRKQETQQKYGAECTGMIRQETDSGMAVNRWVAGSSPARGAKFPKHLAPTSTTAQGAKVRHRYEPLASPYGRVLAILPAIGNRR
jgi:hypothetical protein